MIGPDMTLLLLADEGPKEKHASVPASATTRKPGLSAAEFPFRRDWRLEDALRHQGVFRTKGLRVPAARAAACAIASPGYGKLVNVSRGRSIRVRNRWRVVSSARGSSGACGQVRFGSSCTRMSARSCASRSALVVPRLAMVGERLGAHFGLPGPPGRGEREELVLAFCSARACGCSDCQVAARGLPSQGCFRGVGGRLAALVANAGDQRGAASPYRAKCG
jgi:hypothetical protein